VSPEVATGTFSGGGDLGLLPTLTSGRLMTDLTNIGKLLDVLSSNDPSAGSGHPNTPNVTGVGFGNLDQGGKPEFKDLTSHDHNIGPKH
jgi:hypothetical protein